MYLSELENFTDFHDQEALIWLLDDITFGSWTDGPYSDGSRIASMELAVPEVL